jgi:N-acetylmuramoyl-L-alanine amidase
VKSKGDGFMRVGDDPGHGGSDPGAIGPTGLKEKDVTLPIGLMLGELLKFNGIEPVYTRQTDTSLVKREGLSFKEWQKRELNAREKIIDDAKCDIAVSIHCNGSTDPRHKYISTYIYARGGKAEHLAIFVQRHLVESTGWEDGGIKVGNLHMVRETDMPAILVELGFITNEKQEAWLKEKNNQYKLAKAIAQGICDYYCRPFKEPGEEKKEMGMFKDVDPKKWYAGAVEEAARLGLMSGIGAMVFDPERAVTRAELAAVAVRLYKATNEDFVEVIHKVLPSVVQVENFELGGLGSGTIISENGLVLTNAHVIMGEKEIKDNKGNVIDKIKTQAKTVGFRTTELDWSYAEGPVIAVDEKYDLALCQIELKQKFPALPFGKFESVKKAQKVMAIGSPLGMIGSVTEGVVSAIREDLRTSGDIYIQTEAEINPGNSGGTLVNLDGELIGVPSCKLSGVGIEGLNFAIGLPTVERFLKQYGVL